MEIVDAAASGFRPIGPQAGSNKGGAFQDKDGVLWYCKFARDPGTGKYDENIGRNEVLAVQLYKLLGVRVPDVRLIDYYGRYKGVCSRIVPGVRSAYEDDDDFQLLVNSEELQTNFVIDAWLADYDVVGPDGANTLLTRDNQVIRIDVGGSLFYRAQGGRKKEFGKTVTEWTSMRDPDIACSPEAFAHITSANMKRGFEKLENVSESQIRKTTEEFPYKNEADKDSIYDTLMARREDLLTRCRK
jgi:hypothetical protein